MFRKIFNSFLVFLISCNLAFAQTTDIQKVRIADFSGGQNSKDFYDKLEQNQGSHVENLFIDNKGQAKTRKGQALYNTDVGSTAFLGLGSFYLDATTSYVTMASGTAVYRNGTSTWTQISTSSMGAGHDTGFIQANNLLFAFNGSANTAYWDGTTWSAGGTWPGSSSPPVVTTMAWLSNYLFGAGNPTHPDWVYVSNNQVPQSWSASDLMKINTGDGQAIVRLEPYTTGDVVAYKERSIFDIDISNIDSTCSPQPTCQWTIKPFSRDIGTPARRSVVNLGNDQWFLSSEPIAIRSLTRSQFDKVFVQMNSRPIQDIFDGTGDVILNRTHMDKAAGVLFNNKYFLAIATGSSSVNNYIVAYDFISSSWFTISGWYVKDWIVYQNNLYYTDANDGRVVQCFTGTTGDFGQTSSPTVAINGEYQSRGVDFGYPENFKSLDSVSVEFFPTGNYSATISINMDNNGWQDVGTINLSGAALTLPFSLPAILSGSGFSIATLQLQKYGNFKKIQIKVTLDNSGESMILQAIDVYGRIMPWRREN